MKPWMIFGVTWPFFASSLVTGNNSPFFDRDTFCSKKALYYGFVARLRRQLQLYKVSKNTSNPFYYLFGRKSKNFIDEIEGAQSSVKSEQWSHSCVLQEKWTSLKFPAHSNCASKSFESVKEKQLDSRLTRIHMKSLKCT